MDQAKICCAVALPNKQANNDPILNIYFMCDHLYVNFQC